jgi:hypothetical protein
MNKLLTYSEKGLSLLFGIVVWLFFTFFYSSHLHYQEQFQLFLFTSDYWSDLMSCPGGLADYIGTFLTQFYYYAWLGALIIACLLVLLQQQIYRITQKIRTEPLLYPLTFIPSLLFWSLLCDESYLLASLVAVHLILVAVQLCFYIRRPWFRIGYAAVVLLLLYWLAGGAFWIAALLFVLLEFACFNQFTRLQWTLFLLVVVACVVVPPFIAKQFLFYSLSRLWWGICYNRYPVISPIPLLVAWSSLILIPLLFRFVSVKSLKPNTTLIWFLLEVLVLAISGHWLMQRSVDWSKESVMAYDYSVRMEQWNKVIAMADRKTPDSPLSVACLNLALCQQGKLNDTMFRYFQNGPEGLLPGFQRDFTVPMIVGEIYYHLGFLNTSMRYVFEAMEAIPDYKKSSRAIKRMAEVNLLNGEYKVAEKYLRLLQHTLFYSRWATETLKCLGNETLIDRNPAWAQLRKYRITDDFLFSEQQKDQMLGLLFVHCKTNRIAYEYLIAYTLLSKDLTRFVQYFPLGKELGYSSIPVHYQEALLAFWAGSGRNLSEFPWPVSQAVGQQFTNYVRLSTAGGYAETQIRDLYSQTYWYYLQFRK